MKIQHALYSLLCLGLLTLAAGCAAAGPGGDPGDTATVQLALSVGDAGATSFSLEVVDLTTGITLFDQSLSANSGSASVGLGLTVGRDYDLLVTAYAGADAIGYGNKTLSLPSDATDFAVAITVALETEEEAMASGSVTATLTSPASLDAVWLSDPSPKPGSKLTLYAAASDPDGDPVTTVFVTESLDIVESDTFTFVLPNEPGVTTIHVGAYDDLHEGEMVALLVDTAGGGFQLLAAAMATNLIDLDGDGEAEVAKIVDEDGVTIKVDENNDGLFNAGEWAESYDDADIKKCEKDDDGGVTITLDTDGDSLPDTQIDVTPDGAGGYDVEVTP